MGDNLPFVDLGEGVTVSSVAVALKHACAVIENGFVKCWGESDILVVVAGGEVVGVGEVVVVVVAMVVEEMRWWW